MATNKKNKYLALINNANNEVTLYPSTPSNRRVINKFIKNSENPKNYDVYIIDAFKIADCMQELSEGLKREFKRVTRPTNNIKKITKEIKD